MNSIKINQLTGYTLIGSFLLASIASSVQAFIEIRPFVDSLSASKSWDLFIAMPLLAFTYILGYIFVEFSNLAYDKFYQIKIDEKYREIKAFYQHGKEAELSEYNDIREKLELIQGKSIALLLLSFGLFLKVTQASEAIGDRLEYGRLIFGILALCILCFSPVLFYMAKVNRRKLKIIMGEYNS